jgi:hypothetical protein
MNCLVHTQFDQEVEMNVGMMWFDNDPKTALTAKIERAAKYYQTKYGRIPNLCLVNPKSMTDDISMSGNISIRPQPLVLPGHLWIGLDEKDN